MRTFVPWMLVSAILLHFIQGVIILHDPSALHITALHELSVELENDNVAVGMTLIGCAVLSALAISIRPGATIVSVLLLPQQALLFMTARSSWHAMQAQMYGDGVVRPLAFIASDQLGVVIMAVVHAFAMVSVILSSRNTGRCTYEGACEYREQ